MIIKTALFAALLAASPVSQAHDPIGELSRQSGLSERHVRMLLGPRTPYAEYRYTYATKLKQFKAAIGEDNYQRLLAGKPMLRDAADVAPRRRAAAAGEMEATRGSSAP